MIAPEDEVRMRIHKSWNQDLAFNTLHFAGREHLHGFSRGPDESDAVCVVSNCAVFDDLESTVGQRRDDLRGTVEQPHDCNRFLTVSAPAP